MSIGDSLRHKCVETRRIARLQKGLKRCLVKLIEQCCLAW